MQIHAGFKLILKRIQSFLIRIQLYYRLAQAKSSSFRTMVSSVFCRTWLAKRLAVMCWLVVLKALSVSTIFGLFNPMALFVKLVSLIGISRPKMNWLLDPLCGHHLGVRAGRINFHPCLQNFSQRRALIPF